ncbi:BrnA antitoxin family protein [[Limnothrix rosea] IAM M-220]|uniref:BrnA antitoxin family protein n=1 Tax=[Limnothrix rosea] IAM M-220 TaxID=454133 RepID=UPI00095DB8D5|nr:BrnA antitoxin family protein [[Limnothrix rosea] IAM M-220]OKH17122.1 3-oxoacyl-ACP synthase [[Limnothrix rosea] IAM M-220]
MTISPDRLKALQEIPDEDIDTSDIPELDQSFWENAKLVEPPTEQAISISLDQDILDWFKAQGKSYQAHINQVLRSYILSQSNKK